jgi:hypothetical protein
MQEDSHRQLLAIREELDDLIGAAAEPTNLPSLLRIADGLTELLLVEISRARARVQRN